MAANDVSTGVRLVRVPEDRDGQRLDNFLLLQLKGAPRSLVYKLVRSGQVRINGKRAKADSRLSGGDEVRIPPVKLNEPGEQRPPPKGLLDRLAAEQGQGIGAALQQHCGVVAGTHLGHPQRTSAAHRHPAGRRLHVGQRQASAGAAQDGVDVDEVDAAAGGTR